MAYINLLLILCYEFDLSMKICLVLVLVANLVCKGQTLLGFWETGTVDKAGFEAFEGRVARHVNMLKDQRHKDDVQFLFQVYRKTSKAFFEQYQPLVEFNQLADGVYDCLTATALYTVILNELNFPYRVYETNYHIFLTVQLPSREILIETTDRLTGFITDEAEINRIRTKYVRQAPVARANKTAFDYSGNLDQAVSDEQLNGLLLFNQAVKAYNDGSWKASDDKLRQSERFYQSARTRELRELIQLTRTIVS